MLFCMTCLLEMGRAMQARSPRKYFSDTALFLSIMLSAFLKNVEPLQETGMKDGQEDFEQEYEKIMRRLKELQKARVQTAKENRLAECCQQRAEDLEQYVRKTSWLRREFDEELARRLIRVIKVVNENKLEIQFHSGIVLVQRMDFEE